MKAYWPLALLLALSQVGCNTVEGVGEDIEDAGDAIEDTAEDADDDSDE